jgi:hypothetical protein
MNLYQLFALIIIPCTLCSFSIDFLSDKDITHSETKTGLFLLLHHLICTIQGSAILNLFISNNIPLLIITCLITVIAQIGWIINKDHCFLTRFQNNLINSSRPFRKWRASVSMYLKHYIRGDEWAYADFTNYRNNQMVIVGNTIILIWCIKILLTKKII